uniref:RRM domain-containing protein n=1 Tax=Arcella intermedia TaxID=1963864 RepID=A0A6B2LAL8_9EUKA
MPPKKQKIIVNPPNANYDKEPAEEEDGDPETVQPESDIEEEWEDDEGGEAEFFNDPEENEDPALLSDLKSFMSGTNFSEFSPEDEDEDEEDDRRQKKRNTGGDQKCSLLIGGILVGTPRREIRELFNQYGFGNIRDVRILFNKDNTKPTCCAFVDLPNKTSGKRAIDKLHGIAFKGKKLDVKMVDNQTTPRGYALYVKNLSFKTTKEKLKEVFSECGEIIDIRMPVHEDSGKPKGQAWIEFKTAEARQTARQKDRVKVDGRQLLLSNANDKNFVLL